MGKKENKPALTPKQVAERLLRDIDPMAGLDVAKQVVRKPENMALLSEAMQELFIKDPARFFSQWIHPRLPALADDVGGIDFAPLSTAEIAADMDEATSPRQE